MGNSASPTFANLTLQIALDNILNKWTFLIPFLKLQVDNAITFVLESNYFSLTMFFFCISNGESRMFYFSTFNHILDKLTFP